MGFHKSGEEKVLAAEFFCICRKTKVNFVPRNCDEY